MEKIENALLAMGIPPSLKGFAYITDAMEIFQEKGVHIGITTELYPAIAKKNNTTASRVERAIRHALEVARSCRSDHEVVNKYIGFINCANSASLTMLYKRIQQEVKERSAGEKTPDERLGRNEYDQFKLAMEVRKIVRQELIRIFGESAKAGLKD